MLKQSTFSFRICDSRFGSHEKGSVSSFSSVHTILFYSHLEFRFQNLSLPNSDGKKMCCFRVNGRPICHRFDVAPVLREHDPSQAVGLSLSKFIFTKLYPFVSCLHLSVWFCIPRQFSTCFKSHTVDTIPAIRIKNLSIWRRASPVTGLDLFAEISPHPSKFDFCSYGQGRAGPPSEISLV